jgi:hypothetical protein
MGSFNTHGGNGSAPHIPRGMVRVRGLVVVTNPAVVTQITDAKVLSQVLRARLSPSGVNTDPS